MKKLLVDGNNIAQAAFYINFQNLENESGRLVEASVSLFNTMLFNFSHLFKTRNLYIAWDGKQGKDWRREILPEYKAKRNPPLPVLLESIQACRDSNLYRNITVDFAEGDDVIYALSHILDGDKTIVSADKDFIQIVQEGFADNLYNFLKKEFRSIPELDSITEKSIVGDSSDNLIGIKGIGPAKMKKLLESGMAGLTPEQMETFRKHTIVIGLKNNPHKEKIYDKVLDILGKTGV